jgi:hypothetical protein
MEVFRPVQFVRLKKLGGLLVKGHPQLFVIVG